MNNGSPIEIERDLIRWSRAKWGASVVLVLAAQGALFFTGGPQTLAPRTDYPKTPVVRFSPPVSLQAEWMQMQDPTLFASANPQGFSGPAWINKAPWTAPQGDGLARPVFLGFKEFSEKPVSIFSDRPGMIEPRRPVIRAEIPDIAVTPIEQRSRYRLEGLEERPVVSIPEIPIQYVTDALRSSVVQVLVDTDGFVISQRLISGSGSKTADADALRIAKRTRFEPEASPNPENSNLISTGKLVFDWHLMSPGKANGKE